MSHPFFSIVIPTYNRADFLPGTLDSVLQQTFSDYEIIIIDDSSTDNTKETLKSYLQKYAHVKYFWQQNQERGAARNFGMQQSDGEYFIFFDSDDVMLLDYLEILFSKILQLNKPNFIATKYELQRNKKRFPSSLKKLKEGWYDIEVLLQGNPFACNFCVKKRNPSIQLFEERREYTTMEDWMFLIQNIHNDKIYLIDKITILLNDHPARSMQKDHSKVISARQLATQWIIEKNILNKNQKKKLWSYSFYFCAIHSYLDNKRKTALSYLLYSLKYNISIYKFLTLFLKILIGRKNIQRLKTTE